jgi:Fe-S-cluster containining protein
VGEALSLKYPRNVRFVCDKCAICCGDTEKKARTILLLNVEAQGISKDTKKVIKEFALKIKGSRPYVYQMKKTDEGKCVFLKDKLCSIYEIRPLICRFYPFELKTFEDNYIFTFTDECPRIGKGSRLEKSYFEKLFEESANLMSKNAKKHNKNFK